MPEKEQQLVALTPLFRREWKLANESNPIASDQKVDAVNKQFDAEICKFANTPHVAHWVGTVYQLGLADDDSKSAYLRLVLTARGTAAVSISSMLGTDYVTLSSWMTDRGDNDASLLAKPGTPLIKSLSTLQAGDVVVFDGDFQKIDGPGCLRTNSNIETPADNARANDDRPDYMFKFTKVSKSE
ncbi:hypothetical protein B0E46_09735 [Rhodanobacter sp. B04]|nr:hypothetical protein B0E46_09735 [Rhodanobacter sp. B04]